MATEGWKVENAVAAPMATMWKWRRKLRVMDRGLTTDPIPLDGLGAMSTGCGHKPTPHGPFVKP